MTRSRAHRAPAPSPVRGLGLGLAAAVLAAGLAAPSLAAAPGTARAGWSGMTTADPAIVARLAAPPTKAAPAADAADAVRKAARARKELVGTWHLVVSSPDFPPFQAYHTYSADGTFSETTDLLATLTEGVGHGSWWGFGPEYFLTFELFAFADDGTPAGRIRVRNLVTVDGPDHLSAVSVVDFIELDGTVIPEVGTGTFEGTRLHPLFVAP